MRWGWDDDVKTDVASLLASFLLALVCFSCFYDYQRRKWRRNTIHITRSLLVSRNIKKYIFASCTLFLSTKLSYRRNDNSEYSCFFGYKNFHAKSVQYVILDIIIYLMLCCKDVPEKRYMWILPNLTTLHHFTCITSAFLLSYIFLITV